eukprot:scaffold141782_cov43-Cyclotella_meneghiniana.AAC.1
MSLTVISKGREGIISNISNNSSGRDHPHTFKSSLHYYSENSPTKASSSKACRHTFNAKSFHFYSEGGAAVSVLVDSDSDSSSIMSSSVASSRSHRSTSSRTSQ